MKFILTSLTGVFLALSIVTACQPAAAPTNISRIPSTPAATTANPAADDHAAHDDDAPRITLADAKADFDAGKAVFLDTRNADSYNAEHIKGALNISAGTLAARLKDIPRGKKIIAYCS